jgi:phage-related holin
MFFFGHFVVLDGGYIRDLITQTFRDRENWNTISRSVKTLIRLFVATVLDFALLAHSSANKTCVIFTHK